MLFYTYVMACGQMAWQMASTHACIYDLASSPVNGSQHCRKKDSALEGTGLVEDLLGDREDILEIQMYGKTHIRFGAHALIFFCLKCHQIQKAGYCQVRGG